MACRKVGLAGAPLLATLLMGSAHAAAPDAQLQDNWRAALVQTPTPHAGCFRASYPRVTWHEVACKTAPTRLYLPRTGSHGRTVGNGTDYLAQTSGITTMAVASFPTTPGLTKEVGGGTKNSYSLQLNSDFMSTAACKPSKTGKCLAWLQYVYSSDSLAAFMQYWLINYGSKCPTGGWSSYMGSCYKNSTAVSVPRIAATALNTVKISGTAVSGGNDTLVMTVGTEAYTASGLDSVVDLATAWHGSEYNIFGDGGGSEATLNKGTTINVQIAVTDGTTNVPTCKGDAGTTGETNNLTLGKCTTVGGAAPAVTFSESRK